MDQYPVDLYPYGKGPEFAAHDALYYAAATYRVNWWRNVLLISILGISIANLIVSAMK